MSFLIQSAYAAAAPAPTQSFLGSILLPVAFFAIFYFLIIRPQQKRNKQHKAMIDALGVGNEVVFAAGLMGIIKKIEGDYALIALGNGVDVKVQRASVISVLPSGTLANI